MRTITVILLAILFCVWQIAFLKKSKKYMEKIYSNSNRWCRSNHRLSNLFYFLHTIRSKDVFTKYIVRKSVFCNNHLRTICSLSCWGTIGYCIGKVFREKTNAVLFTIYPFLNHLFSSSFSGTWIDFSKGTYMACIVFNEWIFA